MNVNSKSNISIVFDSGPIISLATNGLLSILPDLKNDFEGDFLIASKVKEEVIDRPLTSKNYQFEALRVLNYISDGTITVVNNAQIEQKANELLALANRIYRAQNNNITIVHIAEMQVLAIAIIYDSSAVVIDERTARHIIDKPFKLQEHLQNKLHTQVTIDKDALRQFYELTKDIKVLRSVELLTIAFEKGHLKKYFNDKEKAFVKDINRQILTSGLWALKLNGCAVTEREIEKIVKAEGKFF